MRKLSFFAIASVSIFVSCQKVLDLTSQFQDPKSIILDKVTFPLDSAGNSVGTTTYTYDAQKRLSVEKTVVLKDGQLIPDSYTKYERDALGRITRTIYTSAGFAQNPGPDSIYTYFYYQSSTSNLITYTRNDIPSPEHLNADSTVYSYNAERRLSNLTKYYSADGPFDNESYSSVDYGYDASGNRIKSQSFSYHHGIVRSRWQYEGYFDDKVDPLYASVNDPFKFLYTSGPNNMTGSTLIEVGGITIINPTIFYTYRPDGRPTREIMNGKTTKNYFYK